MVWSFAVTVSDNTQPIQDLATLLKEGSVAGYTVAPSTGYPGQLVPTTFGYRSIQAHPSNGAGVIIYIGDANTKSDGTQHGVALAAGNGWDRDIMTNRAGALGVYVTASADGAVFTVMLESV